MDVENSELNEDIVNKIFRLNLFDEDYYLEKYPDVKISGVGAFEHYMTKGFKEGRNPTSTFDTKFYLDTNPDVRDAGINPLLHYAKIGRNENRLPNSWDGFASTSSTNSEKNFLTREMIINLEKSDVYYKGRWIYYKEVINIIKLLKDIDNILEVGPYKSPMIEGTDVIDVTDKFINEYPLKMNKFHMHDCMKIPYPIEDKKYDLIIACQVLEHLGIYGQQKQIFNEFERISDKVLVSLPYKWFSPNMRDHHMIDEKMIDYWANNRKPVFQLIVNHRIIRIYEF